MGNSSFQVCEWIRERIDIALSCPPASTARKRRNHPHLLPIKNVSLGIPPPDFLLLLVCLNILFYFENGHVQK